MGGSLERYWSHVQLVVLSASSGFGNVQCWNSCGSRCFVFALRVCTFRVTCDLAQPYLCAVLMRACVSYARPFFASHLRGMTRQFLLCLPSDWNVIFYFPRSGHLGWAERGPFAIEHFLRLVLCTLGELTLSSAWACELFRRQFNSFCVSSVVEMLPVDQCMCVCSARILEFCAII